MSDTEPLPSPTEPHLVTARRKLSPWMVVGIVFAVVTQLAGLFMIAHLFVILTFAAGFGSNK